MSHKDLFPGIPERTRFNRRRRNLMFAINLIRKTVLQMMDLAQDDQCVIDSLPMPGARSTSYPIRRATGRLTVLD
jgi:hypothetical protein